MKHILSELLTLNILNNDEAKIIELESKKTGLSEVDCILKLGLLNKGTLNKILMSGQNASELSVDFTLLKNVPYAFCVKRKCIPIFIKDRCLHIVMSENDVNTVQEISAYVSFGHYKTLLFSEEDIYGLIEKSYTQISNWMDCIESSDNFSIEFFINRLLINAVEKSASDIHITCHQNIVIVRYRISGLLKKVFSFHRDYYAKILIRLKVMFLVDITSSFKKRDGRMQKVIFGELIDFRISFHSCTDGESIMIRIIQRIDHLSFKDLGYNENCKANIEKMLKSKEGMILIIGPTGCGKTTSMYVALKELNNVAGPLKIMTAEDPVECNLSFAEQTDVNDHPDMNFFNIIKSIYRQDPDVLVVGEVRDKETAQSAVQVSMTGHLVITTLHANNVFTVLDRLATLGLDTDLSVEYIVGIVAQRLLPKICQDCSGKGCASCLNSGRRGVCLVSESLVFNDEVRKIFKDKNISHLEKETKLGMFGYISMGKNYESLVSRGWLLPRDLL